MTVPPPPLLSPPQVDQAKHIGRAIRAGEVAAMVGTGLSLGAGLPNWRDLCRRLILAWKDLDPSEAARSLNAENYVAVIRRIFGDNDLAFVSYLRRTLPTLSRGGEGSPPSFSLLLFRALYSDPRDPSSFLYPMPSDLHRHLVATFATSPGHLWTTNYDDLLERAAADLGHTPRPLDMVRHRVGRGLLVTHLHGYLPPVPPDRVPIEEEIEVPVVLAEDDYHAVAAHRSESIWIEHEFHRLFEEHHVLILGMSLVDQNLRRVLATLAPADPPPRVEDTEPTHHAVLAPIDLDDLALSGVDQAARAKLVADSVRMRAAYWQRYGVGIVDLEDHDQTLPLVMRIRYESSGGSAGSLWRQAARRGWEAIHPWNDGHPERANAMLGEVLTYFEREFDVPSGEVVDIGIFLLNPALRALELVFRAGRSAMPRPGERTFPIDPDEPTGVAGCAFVTGSGLRMDRHHALFDYHAPPEAPGVSASYEGLIAAPLVDWREGAVPLGVVYLTTSSTTGKVFALDQNEVTAWLQTAGLAVVDRLKGR